MSKLLVVNSFGPMGSTLLAGLLEKLSFTNVPLRKLSLHQYLMGEATLESGLMQGRLRDTLEAHSRPMHSGGVSVIDRDDQPARALVDINSVRDRISLLPSGNIAELYYACRNLYCDAVTYKNVQSNRDWHIEMTVDIHRFESAALYDRYCATFDDVRMIHLHRPFTGWINSLASQAMSHPQLKNRLTFFPHMRHADYSAYERSVSHLPGLHLQFDDLFDSPIEELATSLASFTGVTPSAEDLRGASFDLYGKFVPYAAAFKRFDDNNNYLHKNTLAYLSGVVANGQMNSPIHRIKSWMHYLFDMSHFRRKNTRKTN